jgi:hypothetical protein
MSNAGAKPDESKLLTTQFLMFLGIGLVLAASLAFSFYLGSKDAALAVNGEILKVRAVELSPKNMFVMTDFRIRNTSNVPFSLREASIFVTLADGKELEGRTVSRPDIENIFKFTPLAGPQYNKVLAMSDRVAGKVAIDRMAGATFAYDEKDLQARKTMRLHLIDMDGKEFDLFERKAQ